MKKIVLNDLEFEIVENIDDCFDLELFKSLYTDYFYEYDYILGDYAYNKLRLKGFCVKSNKKFNNINDFKDKDKYLKEQCAYKCKYFVLKRVKNT